METYTQWSVVFGEQPTAAKWNILGSNDARFNSVNTNAATGWIDPEETWNYASASSFTVSGDKTAKYASGTKIKLNQSGDKFFYVLSSSHSGGTTTVNVFAGSVYTVANAAITGNYYSYADAPQGFPTSFALTSTTNSTLKFYMVGKVGIVSGWAWKQLAVATSDTLTVTTGVTFLDIISGHGQFLGYKTGAITNGALENAGLSPTRIYKADLQIVFATSAIIMWYQVDNSNLGDYGAASIEIKGVFA